jgi:hypothetical protein
MNVPSSSICFRKYWIAPTAPASVVGAVLMKVDGGLLARLPCSVYGVVKEARLFVVVHVDIWELSADSHNGVPNCPGLPVLFDRGIDRIGRECCGGAAGA